MPAAADTLGGVLRTEAVIDLAAIRGNVATLKAATSAEVMAVVKADGYGHGLLAAARAALAGGATWLGTAMIDEAIALRDAGITAPTLAWLWTPGETEAVRRAVATGVDLSVSSPWQLDMVRAAAGDLDLVPRIHLKIDTGLSRNGADVGDWPTCWPRWPRRSPAGEVEVIGVWSHFAYADEPGHPMIAQQVAAFRDALADAARVGIEPQLRHLANSAATLTLPEAHFDLVRPGIAVYGLSPVPQQGDFGLVPAMTLRAALASVKRVRAGSGVLRARLHDRARDDAGAGAARVRRRHPAQRDQRRPGVDQRLAVHRQRPGLHGPGRRRRR